MEDQLIYTKLSNIEREIEKIKLLLATHTDPPKKKKKLISLKGLWEGLSIKDEEIEEAKNFLEKEWDT